MRTAKQQADINDALDIIEGVENGTERSEWGPYCANKAVAFLESRGYHIPDLFAARAAS